MMLRIESQYCNSQYQGYTGHRKLVLGVGSRTSQTIALP